MSKKIKPMLAILGMTILLAYFGYYLYIHYYVPPNNTLPPPLAKVEFPNEQIQYPSDWPEELKFPSEFTLVDSSSGTLPEGIAQGWAAKFRYQGKPFEAEKAISLFLVGKRWSVVEKNEFDSGGYSLLIQRGNGNGIIVVDDDPNSSSRSVIIVTIFP